MSGFFVFIPYKLRYISSVKSNMKTAAIGIFDSGVGGSSIWREIQKAMPFENTIYLADSVNAPYGDKSKEAILDLCIKNTELLLQLGCKIIVVACNTATTNAITYLRSHYEVPIIGIEPAIKPAALKTTSGVVGVLATKGTLYSELFHETMKNHASHIKVIAQEGTGIVPLVESGKANSDEMLALVRDFLTPMLDQKMDSLVLGCTHYPYIIPTLRKIVPSSVLIIDSGAAVAKQTQSVLHSLNLLATSKATPVHQFYTNTAPMVLQQLVEDVPNTVVDFKPF